MLPGPAGIRQHPQAPRRRARDETFQGRRREPEARHRAPRAPGPGAHASPLDRCRKRAPDQSKRSENALRPPKPRSTSPGTIETLGARETLVSPKAQASSVEATAKKMQEANGESPKLRSRAEDGRIQEWPSRIHLWPGSVGDKRKSRWPAKDQTKRETCHAWKVLIFAGMCASGLVNFANKPLFILVFQCLT